MTDIRFACIRSLDISNGENVGVALFVQGCHFKCKNCFNPETWDFNSGKEWTSEVKEKFLNLIDRPYIKRVSLLGGECLADENLNDVLDLVVEINNRFNSTQRTKTIWLYTGYIVTIRGENIAIDNFWNEEDGKCNYISFEPKSDNISDYKRRLIANNVDVIVDGRYIDSLKDSSLHWCGSSNQRVIDVQKSLKQNRIYYIDKIRR